MRNIELNRKLLHLSSVWIPLMINFSSHKFSLTVLAILSLLCIITEIFKSQYNTFNISFNRYFNNLLRDNEKFSQINGATFLVCSSFLTLLFFDWKITIIALYILIIADSVASLIGIRYGKIKLWNKTLEGSSGFFITTLAIMYCANHWYFSNFSFTKMLYTSLLITLVEFSSNKIRLNDNLSVPLAAAFIMSYM
jgi:dolichol kinase